MKLDCFSKEHCDLVRCKVGQRKARMYGAGRRRTRRAPMRVSVTRASTAGKEGRPYLQATMVAIMLRIQAKQTTKSAFSLGKAPELEQQLPSLLPGSPVSGLRLRSGECKLRNSQRHIHHDFVGARCCCAGRGRPDVSPRGLRSAPALPCRRLE